MLSGSTQIKYWTFSSHEELKKHRKETWKRYTDEVLEEFASEQLLTTEEQEQILDYYGSVIIELCNQFQPPSPPSLYGTALMYFKRFYINTSPIEYHPKELVYLCIYLAAKIDEYNVSIGQFIQQLAPNYRNVGEFIISNELLLIQKLHFHLTVHNAYRPMEGFLIDIKTRFSELENPEQFRPKAEKFIAKALIADTFLLFPPSQIALAALGFSMGPALKSYILKVFGENANTEKLLQKIETIIEIVRGFSLADKNELARIKEKLAHCRCQEHNPLSELYQAKELQNKKLKREMKEKRYEQLRQERDEDEDMFSI